MLNCLVVVFRFFFVSLQIMKRISNPKVDLALLYGIATLVCVAASLYFISSFKDLRDTQSELSEAQYIFEETSDLVTSLNAAQMLGEMYVISRNPEFLKRYQAAVDSGFMMLDTLILDFSDVQQKRLFELSELFQQKEILLRKISSRPDFSNYSNILRERAKPTYEHNEQERIVEPKVESDTVFINNRGFFGRIGQLFSSSPGPTQIITIRQSDSIIHEQSILASAPDSLIDTLLQTIEQDQKKQIQNLEKGYMDLLSAEQQIGHDISTVLVHVHRSAINRVTQALEQRDHSARQVLFAGILAFVLIGGFVFMIFQSAKKSLKQSHEMAEAKRITEELMHSRHQLLLSISHDIKAPLCSILSYLDFWDKDNLSTDEIRQLSSMHNSATHILDMLTNLLEFSRLEQKKTQIQNQQIEPIPLFSELVDLFKPLAIDKNLKLLYQFEHLDDVQISSDPLKLRQIATNLLSNAIKYTTSGEIQLFVELLDAPTRLHIKVSDTGIGMPQEKLNTIFDSFVQLENRSGNVEGSGLGLFVVKGLTEVMNGTIRVESSAQKGTTFDVEVPVLQL